MKPKIGDAVEGTVEKIWIYEMGQIIHCPDGYIFKDENGNVINATKIVLEKSCINRSKAGESCRNAVQILDSKEPYKEHYRQNNH